MALSSNQLNIIRPEIKWFLTLSKYLLYSIVFPVAGLTIYSGVVRIEPTILEKSLSFKVALITGFSILSIVFLSSPVFRQVRKRIDHIEYWLFSLCSGFGHFTNQGWRCWIIPTFYKLPFIEYSQQSSAVSAIVESIISDSEANVSTLIGPSASGKTRCVSLAVRKLSYVSRTNRILNKIFFYDLNEFGEESLLAGKLGALEHKNSLVFIDNFHLASGIFLSDLTNYLINNVILEKHFVLMCQPLDRWSINPSSQVKLIEYCKSKKSLFNLNGISSRSVEIFSENVRKTAQPEKDLLFNLRHATQVAQTIFVSSLSSFPLVDNDPRKTLIRLLTDTTIRNTPQNSELIKRLAIVTALAIHRGYFSAKDFYSLYWHLTKIHSTYSRVISLINAYRWLRSMRNLDVFPLIVTSRSRHILHEKLAENWKDLLWTNPDAMKYFVPIFEGAVKFQLENGVLGHDAKWLLAVEANFYQIVVRKSDQALSVTSISKMISCLERNTLFIDKHKDIKFNYGMLLNKNGQFEKSKKILKSVSIDEISDTTTFAQFALVRIEAEHGDEARKLLKQLSNVSDELYQLCAAYWTMHIDAHQGFFAPDKLLDLLHRVYSRKEQIKGEYRYDEIYLLSRLIFDGCRHCYLKGEKIAYSIGVFLSHPAKFKLAAFDSQYAASVELYGRAHFLMHEILFRTGIFGTDIGLIEKPKGFLVDLTEDINENQIIELAKLSYEKAQDMFYSVGGREFSFLKADILNAAMILAESNSSEIENKLESYQAFIEEGGFVELFSYPYYYRMKWHMLNFFQHSLNDSLNIAEHHLDCAVLACKKMLDFDKNAKNKYGIWRGKLFTQIIRFFTTTRTDAVKNPQNQLLKLKYEAKELGFVRDEEIVDWLNHKGDRPALISLFNFFRFYPFVHQ